MIRTARALRAVAFLAAAAIAVPAAAFVRSSDKGTGKDLYWPTPLVPYRVGVPDPSAQSPSCVATAAGDPTLEAARAAFTAWHQACASLDLVFAGEIPEVRTGLDGPRENLVVLRKGWCSVNPDAAACMASGASGCGNTYDCFEDQTPEDRSIVALTSALYDPDTGRIVNADIEVNGWDGLGTGTPVSGASGPVHGWYFTCDKQAGWAACASYGQADCFYIDLQNTITHEAGHFVGLAHPCGDAGQAACPTSCQPADTACQDLLAATMFPTTSPGDLGKRTLSADDVAGLCTIYPENGGGCGSGGAPGTLAALLALVALWPRWRARVR